MAMAVTPGLERRLKAEVAGDVLFDSFSRGRYGTDASHYQIVPVGVPVGVVVPRDMVAAERAIGLAREEGISVLPRGGGTSQCGQTVNESLVIDCSKHLTRIIDLDVAGRRCVVEPGIVLDDLNRTLKPHGLWFPVDISTSSRATIGGMAANNAAAARCATARRATISSRSTRCWPTERAGGSGRSKARWRGFRRTSCRWRATSW
jgi:FAD/FMN-containing dehydrogenase